MKTIVRRLPFTLLMVGTLLLVGLRLGSYRADVTPHLYERWGVGYPNVVKRRKLYTLLTAVFVTRRPFMLYGLMAFVSATVGVYEWLTTPRRAATVFWASNLSADALSLATAAWLGRRGNPIGQRLLDSNDAGASGGATGVAGALCHQLPKPYRQWALGSMLLFVFAKPLYAFDVASDTAHFFAFFLGYGLDWLQSAETK
jgi:hypothetical protein